MKFLVLALSGACFWVCDLGAQPNTSFIKSKFVVVKGRNQDVVNVTLRFGDSELAVIRSGEQVLFTIPYRTWKSASYEFVDRHRLEEGLVAGVLIMATESRSHWLAIQHDRENPSVFRLHKDEYRQVLATIESRTGKTVEIVGGKGGLANPTAGSRDVDELVPWPGERILAELRPAMEKYNCHVSKTRPPDNGTQTIECNRSGTVSGWKPGADAGPTGVGGEKVVVTLENLGEQTRVRVQTRKGFVGRLRKRNWSEPIFREVLRRLEQRGRT